MHKPILQAIKSIKNGGVVVFPTDTVYGLGADLNNKKAVERIYAIKGRARNKPLIILLNNKKRVSDFALEVPSKTQELISKYWPGPLTIILRAKKSVPSYLTAGRETIGLRIPNNKMALDFIKNCGGAIASTSANLSGNSSPTTAAEAKKQIGDKVDFIIDGGKCSLGVASTIIDFSKNKIKILRQGSLKIIY